MIVILALFSWIAGIVLFLSMILAVSKTPEDHPLADTSYVLAFGGLLGVPIFFLLASGLAL